MGKALWVKKKHPRVSGYSVPDVPKQNTAFRTLGEFFWN